MAAAPIINGKIPLSFLSNPRWLENPRAKIVRRIIYGVLSRALMTSHIDPDNPLKLRPGKANGFFLLNH